MMIITTIGNIDDYIHTATNTKEKLFLSGVKLFSTKGYNNVGIRELCASVGIKESSFYNHFKNKEALFDYILNYFVDTSSKVIFTDQEINEMIESHDVSTFFKYNMKKFSDSTGNPLIHTITRIVFMESYTNKAAYNIAKNNLYYSRKDYTIKVLSGLMANGSIVKCDVEIITSQYYYGLKGLLDEYLLHAAWGMDIEFIMEKISNHISFYTKLLKGEGLL